MAPRKATTSSKAADAKKVTPIAPKRAAPKKAEPKKAALKKPSPKKAAPKKAAPKKAAPKKAPVTKSAPKKASRKPTAAPAKPVVAPTRQSARIRGERIGASIEQQQRMYQEHREDYMNRFGPRAHVAPQVDMTDFPILSLPCVPRRDIVRQCGLTAAFLYSLTIPHPFEWMRGLFAGQPLEVKRGTREHVILCGDNYFRVSADWGEVEEGEKYEKLGNKKVAIHKWENPGMPMTFMYAEEEEDEDLEKEKLDQCLQEFLDHMARVFGIIQIIESV